MMNSKIIKKESNQSWGEDPHVSLASAKQAGSDKLVKQAEELICRRYRMGIRDEFENNLKMRDVLTRHTPATGAVRELLPLLSHICREESLDLFNSVLHEMLGELDTQRKQPGSMYLVDPATGKTSLAIGPKHIYQPPDFVGEDGKIRKSSPIVHPGIVAPMALDMYEKARVEKTIEKFGKNNHLAIEHMLDPEVIRTKTIEALHDVGVNVGEFDGPSRNQEIEFGKELIDGSIQSLNPKFHRAHVFSQVLYHRIIAEVGNQAKICQIGNVSLKTNSKKRWYVVTITTPLFES